MAQNLESHTGESIELTAFEVVQFSPDVIEVVFGQAMDGADVDVFRSAIPVSIVESVEACLAKCGIQKK